MCIVMRFLNQKQGGGVAILVLNIKLLTFRSSGCLGDRARGLICLITDGSGYDVLESLPKSLAELVPPLLFHVVRGITADDSRSGINLGFDQAQTQVPPPK